MREVLAYAAAGLVALWGVAHIVPTRLVLAGFDPIRADNRRVVLQEWLAEAFTMWGLAAVVVAATLVGGAESAGRTSDDGAWRRGAGRGCCAACRRSLAS